MPLAVGEAHHLVLDGGAVARPDAARSAPGIHRRAVQVGADDARGWPRSSSVMPQATCGLVIRSVRNENGTGGSSPGCISSAAQSIGAAVEPRRRAGLEPAERAGRAPAAAPRAHRPAPRRGGPPAILLLADDGSAPRRKVPVVSTTAPRADLPPVARHDPGDRALLDDQVLDRRLDHRRGWPWPAIAACMAGPVELAVGLGARALHRRALASG